MTEAELKMHVDRLVTSLSIPPTNPNEPASIWTGREGDDQFHLLWMGEDLAEALLSLTPDADRTVEAVACRMSMWFVAQDEWRGFEGPPEQHPSRRLRRYTFAIDRERHTYTVLQQEGTPVRRSFGLPNTFTPMLVASLFPEERNAQPNVD